MAYISQLKYEDAPIETRKVIDEWVKEHGPLTNMKETLIHSIPAFHALMEWFPLEAEIESFLGERAVNFFCYAISTTNDCLLCSVFFKKILDDAGIDFEHFAFTEEEKVLVEYGRAIVKDANSIPPEIFDMKSFEGVALEGNLYKCADKAKTPHYLSAFPIDTEKPDFHRPEFFQVLLQG